MKSQTYALLTSIWSGDTKPVEIEHELFLRTQIEALLPIRSVILQVPEGPLSGRIFIDNTELMPSLPLGDVIEEEFLLKVPADTIAICVSEAALMPEYCRGKRSELLGRICSDVIIDTVILGNYPLEFEMQAFQYLAEAFVTTGMAAYADDERVDVLAFNSALARRLDKCLIGWPADHATEGPFVQRLCRPTFDLPYPAMLNALLEGDTCYDLSAWAIEVAGTMNAQFDLPNHSMLKGGRAASKSIF